MKRKPSVLRQAVGVVLSAAVLLSYFSPMQQALRELPERMILTEGQTRTLALGGLTLTSSAESVSVSASEDERLSDAGAVQVSGNSPGAGELLLSLLGIPLRRVEVQVHPQKRLMPGGQAIGVAMRTQGVLVVGVSDVDGTPSPAHVCGIRPGDVICRINGSDVTSAGELSRLVAQSGGKPLDVAFLRGGAAHTATLHPHQDAATGTFRMGAWVRDSTAGVGTLSFYDPDTRQYAALGHAITDGDTGQLLSVGEGQILKADIVAVQKGQKGTPGELKGSFLREALVLGDIRHNSVLGLYGQLEQLPTSSLYPEGLCAGLRADVHTGPATILSSVDGNGVRAFDVEITRVNQQSEPAPKSMVLRVVDKELLSITGGIVQGMSGSPIIQDGKLIGAVTHVFVTDPTQGYGVYLDWMLQEAGQVQPSVQGL